MAVHKSITHWTLMKALGDYLKRNEVTQSAFAERIGVSQPTVANLVNGVHSASAALLRKIADETGLTIDELLADEKPPAPPKGRGSHAVGLR